MNQSIFNQHTLKPQNFGTPAFCSTKYSWKNGDQEANLYLDIDKYDVIKEAHFSLKNMDYWIPFFSMLTEEVKNISLLDAFEMSFTDFDFYDGDEEEIPFFPFPIYCLHQAINIYQGVLPAKTHDKDLICRCFGVGRSQIEELIKQNLTYGPKDISEKTRATAGCSSCLEDVEDIIYEIQSSKSDEIIKSFGGHKQLIEKLNQISKTFLVKNSLEKFYEIEILEIKNLNISVKVTPENKKESLMVELESCIKEELGLSFSLLF